MLFEVTSRRTLSEIDSALRESAERHEFGILTVHDLRQTMKDKGVEFDGDCFVYEVCNAHQAKRVLEANGALSTALPCRISVYGSPGAYRVATIAPTALIKMFRNAELLEETAREVEAAMFEIITESA